MCIVNLLLKTNCLCHLKPSLKTFCKLIFFGLVSASVITTKLSVKLVSLLLVLRALSESTEIVAVSLRRKRKQLFNPFRTNSVSFILKYKSSLTLSEIPRFPCDYSLRFSWTSDYHDFFALEQQSTSSATLTCCWIRCQTHSPNIPPSPPVAKLLSHFHRLINCSRNHILPVSQLKIKVLGFKINFNYQKQIMIQIIKNYQIPQLRCSFAWPIRWPVF